MFSRIQNIAFGRFLLNNYVSNLTVFRSTRHPMFLRLDFQVERHTSFGYKNLFNFEIHSIEEKDNDKSFAFLSVLSQQSVYLIQEFLGISLLRE